MTAARDATSECKGEPGRVAPVVDRNRCEAKEDCVRVCPYDVFEIRSLTREDRASLSLLGKLKAWAHGNRQAYVVRGADCHACQLCIDACPEKALTLAPYRG
ncbi:MAG TPA: ferredoxin family protein [Myxococcota bacterium]|nr:ferredoxin family protein [Myxococcota bacterium]